MPIASLTVSGVGRAGLLVLPARCCARSVTAVADAAGAAVAGANQHKMEEMDVDSGTPAASRKEPATKVRPA